MTYQPDVRVGQVWASTDRRDQRAKHRQRCRVIWTDGEHCALLDEKANRRTRVAVARMRPNSTGYRLIQETP